MPVEGNIYYNTASQKILRYVDGAYITEGAVNENVDSVHPDPFGGFILTFDSAFDMTKNAMSPIISCTEQDSDGNNISWICQTITYGSKGKDKDRKKADACRHCGDPGHWIAECPKKDKPCTHFFGAWCMWGDHCHFSHTEEAAVSMPTPKAKAQAKGKAKGKRKDQTSGAKGAKSGGKGKGKPAPPRGKNKGAGKGQGK